MATKSMFSDGGFVIHELGGNLSAWYAADGTLLDVEAFDRNRRAKRVSARERELAAQAGRMFAGAPCTNPKAATV